MNRGRYLFALLIALSCAARPYAEGPAAGTPDISGIYAATHARESWGDVLVQFMPSSRVLEYRGLECPSYEVSIWKDTDGIVRKLRDGLFGTFTLAAVFPYGNSFALLWYSPDENAFRFNKLVAFEPGRRILTGSADLDDEDETASVALEYRGEPRLGAVAGPSLPRLPGVYGYWHSATGAVTVCFMKTGERFDPGNGEEIEAFSVFTVREVPGLGYALAGEGLYGGSLPNDRFTRAGIEMVGGESWLVWYNPARPGRLRKNRIVARYDNGDIGVGLDSGEGKYIEDSVFRKLAGEEAKVALPRDFLHLDGFYSVAFPGEGGETIARFTAAGFDVDGGQLFLVESSEFKDGRAVSLRRGLFSGDSFDYVSVGGRDGQCALVFHSLATRLSETLPVFDLDRSGGFRLGRIGLDGSRTILAEFKKIAASGTGD